MGSSSSQPSSVQRTVVSTDPPSFQLPYIERGFEEAQRLFETPRTFYEGSTVIPFSDQTQAGLSAMENRAMAGSPLVTAAQNLTADTLAGNFLSPEANPYLQSAMDAATRPLQQSFNLDVIPKIQSTFGSAGRYGSGMQANQQARAAEDYLRAVGDVGSQMAFANYNTERGRQINAAQAAPAMAELDYSDPSRLINIGGVYEDMAARQLQEDIDRQRFAEEEARIRLGEFLPQITGGSFQTQTTEQPIYPGDSTARLLGYGTGAAGIAQGLFGGGQNSAFSGLRNLL